MKHKALVILLSLTSLLCSFKTSDSDLEQLYIEDINSLDPNMDKAFCTGDSTFDLPNELSKTEIDLIQPYVNVQSNSISLLDGVYSVLPVNELGIPPDEYQRLHQGIGGDITPPFNPNTGYYHMLSQTYRSNLQKIEFVKENMELMNDIVSDSLGFLESDGSLSVTPSLITMSFNRAVPIISSHSFRWFKIEATLNSFASVLFGLMGIALHSSLIEDFYSLYTLSNNSLQDCLTETLIDLEDEIASYMYLELLGSITNVISTFTSILNALSCSNPMTMLVIRLIQFVFGRFFPCALKSIVMIFSGLVFGYGPDCEMGLFYSKHTPLGYVIR